MDAKKKTKTEKQHSKESYDSILKKMLEAENTPSMEEMFRIGDKMKQPKKYSTEEVVKMCHEWRERKGG